MFHLSLSRYIANGQQIIFDLIDFIFCSTAVLVAHRCNQIKSIACGSFVATYSFSPRLKTRWQFFSAENICTGATRELARNEFRACPRRHLRNEKRNHYRKSQWQLNFCTSFWVLYISFNASVSSGLSCNFRIAFKRFVIIDVTSKSLPPQLSGNMLLDGVASLPGWGYW